MMRIMAEHPQEGTAWEDAYKKCVARQDVVGGGLTLDVTEKFATEAMNLLAQPVRGDTQNHDAHSKPTGKPADKKGLRGYVEHMEEEKLAGQRNQTQWKTRPPRGGCEHELAQLQKDADSSKPCDHCGRMHVRLLCT